MPDNVGLLHRGMFVLLFYTIKLKRVLAKGDKDTSPKLYT